MKAKQKVDEQRVKELVTNGQSVRVTPVMEQNDQKEASPVQSSKRTRQFATPYNKFLERRFPAKDRAAVYVSGELKDKLDKIIRHIPNDGLTMTNYIENILHNHIEVYGNEINSLYREKYQGTELL